MLLVGAIVADLASSPVVSVSLYLGLAEWACHTQFVSQPLGPPPLPAIVSV